MSGNDGVEGSKEKEESDSASPGLVWSGQLSSLRGPVRGTDLASGEACMARHTEYTRGTYTSCRSPPCLPWIPS